MVAGLGPADRIGRVPVARLDLLRWQFDLTWSLFELHLEQLKPEDFLWEPATRSATVRRGVDGV